MAGLQQKLLDTEGSRRRGTVDCSSTSRRRASCEVNFENVIKRTWTYGHTDDSKFQDVNVQLEDVIMMRGIAKGNATIKEIEKSSKVIGRAARRVSSLMETAVGGDQAEADTETGEEDQGGGQQTNGEAVVNLLNNCLGSGMLGVAYCIAQSGLIVGLVVMTISAIVNKYTMLLALRTCDMAQCDVATTEVGKKAFGKPGQIMMVLMYTMLGFFCMVSYVDASADAIKGLLAVVMSPDQIPDQGTLVITCFVFLLFPTTLIRSLSGVAMLSFVAFCGGVLMCAMAAVVCIGILAKQGLPAISEIGLYPPSTADFLNAFPIMVLIFSIQAGGGVVLGTMKDTSTGNIKKVANFSYLLAYIMDVFIGCICYLTFLDKTQGDVMMNFPSNGFAPIMARVALLDLLVLSYMIMCIPCKISILDLVFNKNEALQESSKLEFYGVTILLNLAALGVSLVVSDLSLVLGLNGAICTNFVAFLLPIAFFLKVQSKPENGETPIPIFSASNIPLHLLFLFGLGSLIFSTKQVLERFEAAQ